MVFHKLFEAFHLRTNGFYRWKGRMKTEKGVPQHFLIEKFLKEKIYTFARTPKVSQFLHAKYV